MQGKHVAGIVLCGLAAVMLLIGGLTKTWWNAEKGPVQFGVGLNGISQCVKGECRTQSFAKVGKLEGADKAWVTIGRITFFATFAAALSLMLTVGMGAAGKATGGPVSPSSISAALSVIMLLGGIAFLALVPDPISNVMKAADGGVSYAAFLHLGGSIMGTAGSVMFMGGAGAPPPNYSAMTPQQLAATPGPACRACRKPTRWVMEHSKHYCDGCRLYA